MRATYVHTNLIAEDWQKLADFYIRVFGCTLVPPERDYAGPDLDRGTGLKKIRLRGVHLRLPGWGEQGPTLEIYSYSALASGSRKTVNRAGFGHIAFAVDDVAAARAEVLAQGGKAVGEVVTLTTAAGTQVTWCYVTDPEGNIIELQSWSNERMDDEQNE
jgi:predicted enzyme related to lactoylglutathione lyase